jgi:hypothetical protein
MAITAFGDRFVAVGNDGGSPGRAQAWTSTDGVTWELATVTDAADGTSMNAVTPTATGLVAVGTATSEGGAGPDQVAAWSSADGLTWQPAMVQRPANRGLSASMRHVADGPAGSIALAQFFAQDAGPARLYRTTDGQSWTRIPLPKTGDIIWSALRPIPDGYLLIGNTFRGRPRTFQSTDGETWERVASAPWMLDAAASPDGAVVGIADEEILTTSDLVTWAQTGQVPDPSEDGQVPLIDMVDWADGRFAVSGQTQEGCLPNTDECGASWLYLSPDGTTWTESTGPDGEAGPDSATSLVDMASLGETTVVLGATGPGPMTVWVMPD